MRCAMLVHEMNECINIISGALRECKWDVGIIELDELVIDENLLDFDLVLLCSPHIFHIYAGMYAESRGTNVIPSPEILRMMSNRTELPYLAGKCGLATPRYYMGFPEALAVELPEEAFPLIQKSIVTCPPFPGNSICSANDLRRMDERFLYLEVPSTGRRIHSYFGGGALVLYECVSTDDFQPIPDRSEPKLHYEVGQIVSRWSELTGSDFGYLHLVRQPSSWKWVLLEAGAFPKSVYDVGVLRRISEKVMEKHGK